MGAVSGHQAAGFVEETQARTPTMGALGPAAPPAGSGCPEEVAAGDAAGPTRDAGGGGQLPLLGARVPPAVWHCFGRGVTSLESSEVVSVHSLPFASLAAPGCSIPLEAWPACRFQCPALQWLSELEEELIGLDFVCCTWLSEFGACLHPQVSFPALVGLLIPPSSVSRCQ